MFLFRFKLKLKRFVKISAVLIWFLLILKFLVFYFDLSCHDYNYDHDIKLKNVNLIKSQNDLDNYSVAKWTKLICDTFSIYSSFLIDNQIVTIGLMQADKYDKRKFACQFKGHLVEAKVEILTESWENKYSSVKIKCYLNEDVMVDVKKKFNLQKLFVQIQMFVDDDINCQSKFIHIERVYNTKQKLTKSKNLTVCVRPLFGPFTATSSLLEFIAFYRANLVSKFIIYNLSISSQIQLLLSSMEQFVDVMQFDLPIRSKDIHAEGQIASMTDCLLRNANDHIIFVDIDEFIMTFQHENLKTFIQSNINDSIGSFIFPNCFFCNEFNNKQGNSFPRILNYKIRQTLEWPINQRSKSVIVKPLAVVEQGVHVVWKWNNSLVYGDLVNVYVDRNESMLFHYRSCCRIWQRFNQLFGIKFFFKTYNDNTITDNSMDKFASEIFAFIHQYIEH